MDWISLIPAEILMVVATSAVTFLSTKRRYKAESKNLEHQITDTIMQTYKAELDAMNKRINDYVAKIQSLEEEMDKLNTENDSLKKEIAQLKNMKTN